MREPVAGAPVPGASQRHDSRRRSPVPALVGAPLTFAVWVLALITHAGARYVGPLWLATGLVVFVAVRRIAAARVARAGLGAELPPGAEFKRILVPMKLGDIGEEMVATAIALARGAGPRSRPSPSCACRAATSSRGRCPPRWRLGSTRRSRRRGCSAPITAWRSGPTPSGHARSATRSSTRRVAPRGSHRARLFGALEAPVALLLADRGLRPAASPL